MLFCEKKFLCRYSFTSSEVWSKNISTKDDNDIKFICTDCNRLLCQGRRSKRKYIIIFVAALISIVFSIFLFSDSINLNFNKKKSTELSQKEINRIISSIEQDNYEAINHIQGLEEMNEDQKEGFVYDLERLLLHLETDFHKDAKTSERITRLNQIESSLDFSFCGTEPSIMVTMAGDLRQIALSFKEYSDLAKISPNLSLYLLNATAKKTQDNSFCIDKIHVYAR